MLVVNIDTERIDIQKLPNGVPVNPRGDWDRNPTDLRESIKSTTLEQPIVVRPSRESPGRFLLIHGERRLTAVRSLGWATVPAVVKQGSGDAETDLAEDVASMLAQGMTNQEYSLLGMATAVDLLIRMEYSIAQIAQVTGQKTTDHIRVLAQIVSGDTLSARMRDAVRDGRISLSALSRIARRTHDVQDGLLDFTDDETISVATVMKHLRSLKDERPLPTSNEAEPEGDTDDELYDGNYDDDPIFDERSRQISGALALMANAVAQLSGAVLTGAQRKSLSGLFEQIGRILNE